MTRGKNKHERSGAGQEGSREAQDLLLRPGRREEIGERLRKDRDRQIEHIAEEDHAERREQEREDQEIPQARFMGGIAPNDDRQWPGDGKPEAR